MLRHPTSSEIVVVIDILWPIGPMFLFVDVGRCPVLSFDSSLDGAWDDMTRNTPPLSTKQLPRRRFLGSSLRTSLSFPFRCFGSPSFLARIILRLRPLRVVD